MYTKQGKEREMEIHVALHAFITSRIKQNKAYHTNLFAYAFKNKHTTDVSYHMFVALLVSQCSKYPSSNLSKEIVCIYVSVCI
jgi:hypothetical protein